MTAYLIRGRIIQSFYSLEVSVCISVDTFLHNVYNYSKTQNVCYFHILHHIP